MSSTDTKKSPMACVKELQLTICKAEQELVESKIRYQEAKEMVQKAKDVLKNEEEKQLKFKKQI